MALILVVDDEEDACQLMERIFRASGHHVQTFIHGDEAIRWLKTHVPDVAILDVKPISMDGIRVLKHLQKRNFPTKVILVTGQPSSETDKSVMRYGIREYLVKPLEIEDLEEHVNRALRLIL